MHALGIIHRDIKLANVFVRLSTLSDGATTHASYKIGDFGLACMLDKDEAITQKRVGTTAFMAPEIILG